jgi:orotidine-5'-phosphate decarboxylase
MKTSLDAAQRLIVALDKITVWEAQELATALAPVVSTFKIGHWLLYEERCRSLLVQLRQQGKSIFLDAKLNDIPETVKRGVASAAKSGAAFVTVHSDEAMLRAAIDGKGDRTIKIMAVTALTSLGADAARDRFRAGLVTALISGCDGLIMSPTDLVDPIGLLHPERCVRGLVGDTLIATPGIRLNSSADDHQRVGTPAQAIAGGADYIIVGRPITQAQDPVEAAQRFVTAIEEAAR